jgi:hypothetical protein
MRLRLALAIWLVAAPSSPSVEVTLRAGRVAVHAQRAPLSEVLARFSEVTGARVVYEAARPVQLVSVGIEADSAAEALGRLLEGQGLNYALRLDASGRAVEMLVVTGTSSPAPASAPARGRVPVAPAEPVEETFAFEEPPFEAADPGADPGGAFGPGAPGGGFPEGGFPSGDPGASATDPGAPPGQPQAPGVASYPGAPPGQQPYPAPPVPGPFPAQPAPPTPASY